MTPNPDALSGAWNFRDIAEETGIRAGRFFRSSELSGLDESGRAALLGFGITDVADLRSEREVERRGAGQVPDGIVIHRLPFHELAKPGAEAPHDQSFQRMMTEKSDDEDVAVAAGRFMTEEYQNFPTLPGAHLAVQQVISILAAGRPVITHCFAGKDRTGFGVALLLDAAGVDRDTVMADYLQSNAAVPQLRAQIMEMIRSRFDDGIPAEAEEFTEARLSDDVLGVRPEYLDAALDTVAQDYGSVAGYLRAAEVTDEEIDKLRTALRG